jgi:hypothetical protein
MDDKVSVLVEHYQKTYELTFEMWKQRNRIFLILLAVISIATLLTFRVPEANSLLVDLIAKLLGVSDQTRIEGLRQSFPFGLLQSVLLTAIFYLMVNLYHRAVYVLRSYSYLSELEREIREHLKLPENSVSFTRESTFYWGKQHSLTNLVKWVYIAFLGLLLGAFLVGRIVDDFRSGNLPLAIVDIVIAIPTIIFFFEYARSAVSFDAAMRGAGKIKEQ